MKLTAAALSSDAIQMIVNRKREWILSSSDPLRIILFGSAATENTFQNSCDKGGTN